MFSLDFENNIYQKLLKYNNNLKKILVGKITKHWDFHTSIASFKNINLNK